MVKKLVLSLVLGASFLLGGCVTQSSNDTVTSPEATPAVDSFDSAYVLRPLDPLYIRFSGIAEQQQLDIVVDQQGNINLLHIKGPIKAAGLTPSQLEAEIERLYIAGQIYKNVSVNVTMTAKVFYVQGEVNQPRQFQLMSGTTLLQAIAGAGGPTPFANLKKVTISRYGKIKTYNLKKLEKDPSKDVKIEAGDVIKVWQHWY